MKRFPDTEYAYCTGDTKKIWRIFYDKSENRFKHIVDDE